MRSRRVVYNQFNSPGREVRFWEKVQVGGADECWPWIGSRDNKDYGTFNDGGLTRKTHRVSFELAHGSIPAGLCVCHSCDNPPCVNPAHLWLGTMRDNTRDAVAKGRMPRAGTANGRAKLNPQLVAEIRERCERGEDHGRVAADYGVNRSTINRALRGVSWAA